MRMTSAPAVRLKSGLVVANFSSPHVYNFDDGTVLVRCPPERVAAGSLDIRKDYSKGPKGTTDIRLVPKVTPSIMAMLGELETDDDIDVVLVSAYILRAINGLGFTKPRLSWITDKHNSIVSSRQFGLDQGEG